jgi:sugar phosphate isomerase/epimerase
MHPRVSVSAISTWSWSIEDDLAFYRRAGIDQVGISLRKLEVTGHEKGARLVADAGLRVTNLLGLGPFTLADPARWPAQQDRLMEALGTAETVGAECLILTTGPAGPLPWEEAADALEAAMAPVLAEAGPRGIPFALEHTHALRADVGFVHSLADAVDLARRLGIGVCMEINACWTERGLAETIRRSVGDLRLVQVSDYVIGTTTTPDRTVPGDGDIPLARVLAQLEAAGYRGCYDLELIGPRIEAEGYESAIPRAVAATAALLSQVGAAAPA